MKLMEKARDWLEKTVAVVAFTLVTAVHFGGVLWLGDLAGLDPFAWYVGGPAILWAIFGPICTFAGALEMWAAVLKR